MAERKPCSGMWARAQDDVDQSVGVQARPWRRRGECAHVSSHDSADVELGICSATVVGRCGRVLRRCDATRLPRRENLDDLLGDPCLDLLTYEAIGSAVVMFGNLDVIIPRLTEHFPARHARRADPVTA